MLSWYHHLRRFLTGAGIAAARDPGRPRRTVRPRVELLEDRTVPTTPPHHGGILHEAGAKHHPAGLELKSIPVPAHPNLSGGLGGNGGARSGTEAMGLQGVGVGGFGRCFGFGRGGLGLRGKHGRNKCPLLTIRYTPLLCKDLSRQKGFTGRNFRPVTANLSEKQGMWYVHANNKFAVLDHDKATKEFPAFRKVRQWGANLDVNGNPVTLPSETPGFLPDGARAGANPIDAPGFKVLTPPDKWSGFRVLQEFVVGIQGHAEAGYAYFTVVVDIRPDRYDVYMSQATYITQQEFVENIQNSQRPFQDGTSGAGIQHVTGLLVHGSWKVEGC